MAVIQLYDEAINNDEATSVAIGPLGLNITIMMLTMTIIIIITSNNNTNFCIMHNVSSQTE